MKLTRIHMDAGHFVDAEGRTVILRGVNLGGDCKLPYPDGGTHHPSDFSDHREVSFVGRPFPLEEADEHLGRLRHWGFNCLRLLTTWEAIEHAGPGQLDQAYLDYYTEVCRRAGEHGLYLFVDFHQDVWSRMTGGSGAPGWIFEALGMDLRRLGEADAAIVMQQAYDYDDPRPRQEERYPQMCWSRNYYYPANCILWTLFFGGRDFAPHFEIEGQNVQDFLQGHYLACQRAVAERVAELPNVLGFDTLNEPSCGFIGLGMEERRGINRGAELAMPGLSWSPLRALFACDGNPVRVPVVEVSYLRGNFVDVARQVANPRAVRVWLDGHQDPFLQERVWGTSSEGVPVALKPDHFRVVDGREIDFERDYLLPFLHRVTDNVRQVNPEWMIFFEKDGNTTFVDPALPEGLPERTVYAPHWYDLITLMMKRFSPFASYDAIARKPVLGQKALLEMYISQLSRVQRTPGWAERQVPLLLGEFGIPFDFNGGRAYAAWAKGDHDARIWRHQVRALELMYDAVDALLVSSTQWNYTATNRNDPRVGDGWNQEDLSVFSRDQQDDPSDPDSGGRAITGFVRPFARRIQGTPTSMRFESRKGLFTLEYEADPAIEAATEIYAPRCQFPDGFEMAAVGVELTAEPDAQLVYARARRAGPTKITLRRR